MKKQSMSIALDIGGVCVKLRHREMFEYFGWNDGPPSGLMEMSDRLETGELDEPAWLREFRFFTGNRFSDGEILRGWNIVIGPVMDGMPELLSDLKERGFRLIFFSDTSTIHVAEIYRDRKLTEKIDDAVYSYQAGAKKPGTAMFAEFERRYGKPVLYLDDKPENVAGGLGYGWPARQFTGVSALRRYIAENLL